MRGGHRSLIVIAVLVTAGVLGPTAPAPAQAAAPTGPITIGVLELGVEDYAVKPDVALTKIRKLVERDRVHVVVGIVLSAAAIAVKDYVNAQTVPRWSSPASPSPRA